MTGGVALFTLLALGCEIPYLAVQARGQIDLLARTRTVTQLVHDSDDEKQWRWALAWSAREFAREKLGLAVTDQYQRGIELEGDAVAHVVSAAGRYDLEPYHWWFPVVGDVPYKGFFEADAAIAEAERLAAQGFDVMVRPVATYSLLGYLPDPLLSTMIDGDPERVVEVVIHELAHATVYQPGRSEFNEGLATFIGRRGRQAFIADKLGNSSLALTQALRRDEDADRYREAVMALAQDLTSYYARGRVSEAGKRRIYRRHQAAYDDDAVALNTVRYRARRLPTNNAEVAALKVYTFNNRLYASAFAVVGEDWPAFIALLREAASYEQPLLALERSVRQRVAERVGSLSAGSLRTK